MLWLKVVIVFLFVALLVSLFTSLGFLIKDREDTTHTHRTWNTLTLRLVLAGLLIGFLFYGVATGQLGSNAPWDAARYEKKMAPETNE